MELFGVFVFFVLLVLGLAYLRSPQAVGRAGERRVDRSLRRHLPADQYVILTDLILPSGPSTTQIDHVVLSKSGVFVIETKNMSGWIFGGAEQAKWTQVFPRRRVSFQNPLRQNYKHVKAVEAALGVARGHIHGIVAFVGSAQPRTAFPNSVVWSARDLAHLIALHTDPVFSAEDVSRMRASLERPAFAATKDTRRAHVAALKEPRAAPVSSVSQCPRCGARMVLRTARKTGDAFWGCSRFPKCRGTRRAT